jgi:hypothetical protein
LKVKSVFSGVESKQVITELADTGKAAVTAVIAENATTFWHDRALFTFYSLPNKPLAWWDGFKNTHAAK